MALKALCGIMRFPGYGVIGCFLMESKEHLNVIPLVGEFRPFEGDIVECH